FVNTYRLTGIVPALFLPAALLLHRCLALVPPMRIARYCSIAALLTLACLDGAANIHRVAAQLDNCNAELGSGGFLYIDTSQPILLSDQIHAIGPQQTAFVVSRVHHFTPDLWSWLFATPPSVYDPSAGGHDPPRWRLLLSPPPRNGASFWPPRPESGKTG